MATLDDLTETMDLILKQMTDLKTRLSENEQTVAKSLFSVSEKLSERNAKELNDLSEKNEKKLRNLELKISSELNEIADSVGKKVLQNAQRQIAETTDIYKSYLEKTNDEMQKINTNFAITNDRQKDAVKGFFLGRFGVTVNIVLLVAVFCLGLFFNQSFIAKKAIEGQEQKIVSRYLDNLTSVREGIIDLTELDLKWAKKQRWDDKDKAIAYYEKQLEEIKKMYEK